MNLVPSEFAVTNRDHHPTPNGSLSPSETSRPQSRAAFYEQRNAFDMVA